VRQARYLDRCRRRSTGHRKPHQVRVTDGELGRALDGTLLRHTKQPVIIVIRLGSLSATNKLIVNRIKEAFVNDFFNFHIVSCLHASNDKIIKSIFYT